MPEINGITVLLIIIFILPMLSGALRQLTRERFQHTLGSLFDSLEFLVSLVLSIFITKGIFFNNQDGIYRILYGLVPSILKEFLYGKDMLTYIIATPVILLVVMLVLRLVTTPLYNFVLLPASNILYTVVSSMGGWARRLLGALWQLPKSVYMVLISVIILNFYGYYFHSPLMARWMNESQVYQTVYRNVVYPALNSNLAKHIPVIVNDSFSDAVGRIIPGRIDFDGTDIKKQLAEKYNGNVKVIRYFNGVTLDEAVRSNDEIDAMARKIAGSETNTKKKGYLLYKWISENIEYDYDKAERISKDTTGISSGAIVAFKTRTGICFDYSSLYIAMSRAIGLKTRMVTGLGYSGVAWGDHAWNQVYCEEEDRWINVDATFGSVANYYDKPDFDADHQYAEIQGEW